MFLFPKASIFLFCSTRFPIFDTACLILFAGTYGNSTVVENTESGWRGISSFTRYVLYLVLECRTSSLLLAFSSCNIIVSDFIASFLVLKHETDDSSACLLRITET